MAASVAAAAEDQLRCRAGEDHEATGRSGPAFAMVSARPVPFANDHSMVAEEAAEEAILVVEMVERRLLIGWLVEVG